MDAIEYFKGMRKRLCEDHLKLLPKKSVGYQTTLREMSFYDASIKALEQEPCEDAISRQQAIGAFEKRAHMDWERLKILEPLLEEIENLPSISVCTDAISRSDIIERCERVIKHGVSCTSGEHLISVERVLDKVKTLPSVSIAGKVEIGHWSRKTKVDAYDLCGVKTWGIKCQCDRCTFTTIVVEDFGYYKYCPNCGAKMEVEE